MMIHNNSFFSHHGKNSNILNGIGYTKKERLNNVKNDNQFNIINQNKDFFNIIEELNKLVKNYAGANYDDLDFLLDQPDYNEKIGFQLLKLKTKQNNTFDINLRNFMKNTFEGIQKSLIQAHEYKNNLVKLELCEEKSSILDDNEKLIAYLKKKKRELFLFDIEPVNSISVSLKPEYKEYINRHGLPENVIFDTDKLATIRIELGIE